MDFKFAWLVELLQCLDAARPQKALPASRSSNPDHKIVAQWFSKHGSKIERSGETGYAFLACMFPEKLSQRSYAIQEKRLSAIFGRALGLGASRVKQLNAWQEGTTSFACCVERVMADCEANPPSPAREVTLLEIDATLRQLAANSPFSATQIRQSANNKTPDNLLAPILRRLSSLEAKWLVRMILKSYSPVQIPEQIAMLKFHFLLPSILSIQNTLEAAVQFLSMREVAKMPVNPDPDTANTLQKQIDKFLSPTIGTTIKRPRYEKARSIKHCCNMAAKRLMSVERKYDGEYCQIHIDRSLGSNCVRIFSKSGKESTEDRIRLHSAIKDSLLLDRPGCKIKRTCILEGELLVWKRSTQTIAPFHKIRKHVVHGKRFIGVESDSPATLDEQLMIMYYDLLVLDDKVLACQPHSRRRQVLKGLVTMITGISGVTERELISFSSRRAPAQLRSLFARSIRLGWEGFVLKGSDDPFISFRAIRPTIKLKKDYITALGDTADLCIVGGKCEARVAEEHGIDDVLWTTFYLACIENNREVARFGGTPRFKIIDTINANGISRDDLADLNREGQFLKMPYAREHAEIVAEVMISGTSEPTHVFRKPFVVEVMGAGFDKNTGCNFHTLRFPRLTKLHFDRTVADSMSLEELQRLAEDTMSIGPSTESQEDAQWIERLIEADGRNQYVVDKSQSTSPGKTPRSLAAISVSPASLRNARAPTLVRTDTAELRPSEELNGCESIRKSPRASPTSHRTKRKAFEIELTPVPTVETSRKRQQTTSVLSALSRDSPGSSHATASVAHSATGPSMSPANSRRSCNSPSKRAPLLEMFNVSPRLERRTGPRPSPLECCDTKSAEKQEKTHQHGNSGGSLLPMRPGPARAAGENSPDSKALCGGVQGAKNNLTSGSGTAGKVALAHASQVETTVLLSRSLFLQEQETAVVAQMCVLLRQCDLAFTFSVSYFVSQLLQADAEYYVVLADASESTGVAHDMLQLGVALVNHQGFDTISDSKSILFADRALFLQSGVSIGQSIALVRLREAFISGLKLGNDVTDDKGCRAAEAFWSWNAVEWNLPDWA